MDFLIQPGGGVNGAIEVAADKSISHRALILGALAEGETRIENLLHAEDVRATAAALQSMGVAIERHAREVCVRGVGLHGLRRPPGDINLGNSGTAMRLLAGVLCAQNFPSRLVGDASLSARPMRRIMEPLRRMRAQITAHDDKPPLDIAPSAALRGIEYHSPVASAQVKSAVLFAGLYARGETRVVESAPSRDHSERMLAGFGYKVEKTAAGAALQGGGKLTGVNLRVPADLSSAAFFILGATLAKNGAATLPGVGVNPTRAGVLDILRRMGANIALQNPRELAGEPVADLHVQRADLCGVEIDAREVALAIDEIPAIAVAAASARGVTVIRGAGELRVKESDRIHAIVEGLHALGVDARESADGLRVTGGKFAGGEVQSFGDHRIAMAFSMAALVARAPIRIRDCDNVATSFPEFAQSAARAGLGVTCVRD